MFHVSRVFKCEKREWKLKCALKNETIIKTLSNTEVKEKLRKEVTIHTNVSKNIVRII